MSSSNAVLEMTKKGQQWVTYFLLEPLTPKKRVETLQKVFMLAVSSQNDEVALAHFNFLVQSFYDLEFVLSSEDKKKIRLKAKKESTLKTIELYGALPPSEMRAGERRHELTLFKTRKAMLTLVAEAWQDTEDEEEADNCFNFLLGVVKSTKLHEEDKLLQDVIREATDRGFPLNRLVRHFLLIPQPDKFSLSDYAHKIKTLAGILAIAWARNSEFTNIASLFRAVQPVLMIAQEGWRTDAQVAFELVGQLASEIALLDQGAKELLKMMQPEWYSSDKVPGEIRLTYSGLSLVEVLIEGEIGSSWRRPFKDSEGHEWFEKARDFVIKWREAYPSYSVSLKLLVKSKFGTKPLFVREQEFGQK